MEIELMERRTAPAELPTSVAISDLELLLGLGHRHNDGVDELLKNNADGTDGVVVGRDGILHAIRVGIAVHQRDDRNVQAVRFIDGDGFTRAVHDDDGIRQSFEIADALEVALQLAPLAAQAGEFLFGHGLDIGELGEFFEIIQTGHALADGSHVSKRAAQPAMVNIKLATGLGGFLYGILRLALAADEKDALASAGDVTQEIGGNFNLLEGFLNVDDVDAIAGFEDESLHFWIPTTGLMAKMDSGFDEFCELLI